MATSKIPSKLSHVEGISDYARAQELYKYYQPSSQTLIPTSEQDEVEHDLNISSNVSSSKVSSPDTALTVFCQLTAWRMDSQRAMIRRYFVAESTRSLDLSNSNVHAPGDGLWLGCSSPLSTIAAAATKDEGYPHFIVDDLSKDERFNKLPFVTGAPFLKRYIGVPLITKRGIPIGSLFVVDDRLGNGLSKESLTFLGTMAKTVMRHFELTRTVQEHRRGMKMSQGLSSLIEGRDEPLNTVIEKGDTVDADITKNPDPKYSCCSKITNESIMSEKISVPKNINQSTDNLEKKEKNRQEIKWTLNQKAPDKVVPNEEKLKNIRSRPIKESSDKIINPPENDLEDQSIRALFSRAAHIIQMTFELDGGTVFYDARTGSSETVNDRNTNSTPCESRINSHLLRQYPRGEIWACDENGTGLYSGQNSRSDSKKSELCNKGSQARTRLDTNFFSWYFPGVHQLVFIPLWDAGRSRWFGGCFTWSKDPTRILSKQMELTFLTAFTNSIMAEWARIDTEIADKKKSDFIGSISHELRSPLHGILASVEFLEEVLTGWEKQLVETIESCGRTLLDTINHILDYSKINHFESHWRRSKRAKYRAGVPITTEKSNFSMLSLFQDIDVSVICEEVVDSVYAGHVFQNITAQSFDQISDTQGKMSNAWHPLTYSENIKKSQNLHNDVVVVLDIDPKNYLITSQPGALRRLIMNLLGNSLKYTSHGYIVIRLDCHNIEDFVTDGPNGVEETIPRSMLVFTVTDTGRGIAPEFLRNKLYIPFAQENMLSSGTGLGLSIVRAIVSLLDGEISIDSEINRGTHVKVSIPVLHRMPQIPVSPEGCFNSTNKELQCVHDAVLDLRNRATGHRVSLYGFDGRTDDSILTEKRRVMEESIKKYLINWYHLQVVPYGEKVNFVIAYAVNHSTILSIALNAVKRHGNHPCIIVLCCHSSVLDRIYAVKETHCKVGYTAIPIGPTKLAKAIIQTMDGLPTLLTHKSESQELETNHLDDVVTNLPADNQDTNDKMAELGSPQKINTGPVTKIEIKNECNKSSIPKNNIRLVPMNDSSIISKNINIPKPITLSAQPKAPSILLVDDNQINLRLLSTYLSRRAYPCVDTAQNGLEAVKKFEALSSGYDIIFMDITMPVLDGFGATRQIREIEKKTVSSAWKSAIKNSMDSSLEQNRKPSLIIAFTGRSSIEDQSEAIRSGIDLFMTKPVPFREVGRICDNWIANQMHSGTTSS
ncbi:putative two-component sensor protein histidine protein kinase [Erysiphe neolycopersici]|uniref:Putative two-component sensor protein histidine protein kinase n=1 Tax=Erysiphe neolycopersici TaxID=212602 RepID=A0A420HTG7_9PEZI|nr:putative two-component sensor protein histidine protein kinase [Erysiphe neolycopersici]